VRLGRLRAIEIAADVGAQSLLQLFGRRTLGKVGQDDAGIADQDVEAPEFFDCALDQGRAVGLLGHVGSH